MKDKDIENIIELLKLSEFKEEKPETPDISNFEITEFELPEHINNIYPIISVDGSFSFLFSFLGTETWIVLFRIAVTEYKVLKNRERDIYYIMNSPPKVYDHLNLISFNPKVLANQPPIYIKATEIAANLMERVPQIVASNILSYLEDRTLETMTENYKNCIILKDGALLTFKALDRDTIYKKILMNCRMNNNFLVGISKSTSSHIFHDLYTDDYFLKIYFNKKYPNLTYISIPKEEFEAQKKFDIWGDAYYAKLHKEASKWFRIDIGTDIADPTTLFSSLAAYSMVQLIPGYPIGLLEAHKIAKSVRDLKENYEMELIKHFKELGLQAKDILDGAVDINGRQFRSFHEILDQLSR